MEQYLIMRPAHCLCQMYRVRLAGLGLVCQIYTGPLLIYTGPLVMTCFISLHSIPPRSPECYKQGFTNASCMNKLHSMSWSQQGSPQHFTSTAHNTLPASPTLFPPGDRKHAFADPRKQIHLLTLENRYTKPPQGAHEAHHQGVGMDCHHSFTDNRSPKAAREAELCNPDTVAMV
jgi:hypothetical protein